MITHIDLVQSFIKSMKEFRPDVNFAFEYDEHEDIYRIFHSYVDAHEDREFRRTMSNLYARFFSRNSFYSVSVILNRQLAPFNFVDAYIANDTSKIHSSIEVINYVDTKRDNCSENLDASVNNWSMSSEVEKKCAFELAA